MTRYLNLEVFKLYGDYPDTEDEFLGACLDNASKLIDDYCGRTFSGALGARYYTYGEDTLGDFLYLDSDLLSVVTITNGDATTVTAAQYTTIPRNEKPYYAIRLKDNSGVAWTYSDSPEDAITVSGVWGYSQNPPESIVQATFRLANHLYHQKDASLDSDRAIISDTGVIIAGTTLPRDVLTILEPYRKYGV